MQLVSILDFVFLFFMIGLTLYGYVTGIIMQAARLIEFFASALVSLVAAKFISQWVGEKLSYQFLKEFPWAEGITEDMIREFAVSFSQGIIFVIIFIILNIILGHVIKLLNLVDKVPGVGFLDSLGGGVFGFFMAFLWIYIAGSLLLALVPQHVLTEWGVTQEAMKHSIFFKMFL